ncbi:hypothetical protein [Streptomyces beijiangensis]|uniref:Uncharacterized protein n=1 Tax=Streptomyces beijiangensis TaxID=163361 RepID=A0A939FBI8_9ACTN|nr:hypothetical protein [Streptomyces beijiangensis]MBO0513990.1 hypothetical protein [Streptomyces beijiangensis]
MTVQRDGLGREAAEAPAEDPADKVTAGGAGAVVGESPDGRPVFVDASGRRGRKIRRLGWLAGVVCACYAVMLVVTVLGGNSSAPWLLIPGPSDDGKKAADTVRVPPGADASKGAAAAPGSRTFGATGVPGVTGTPGATVTGTAGASPAVSGSAAPHATAVVKPGPSVAGSPGVVGPLPGDSPSSPPSPAASPSAPSSPEASPSGTVSAPPADTPSPAAARRTHRR